MSIRPSVVLFSSLFFSVSACGGDDSKSPETDAGTDTGTALDVGTPDTATDAGPAPLSCGLPEAVTLALDTPTTLSGDTRGGDRGVLDLGPDCGNYDATNWAPQHVYAVAIPEGANALRARFLVDGTDEAFLPAAVLQVRTSCTTVPEATGCLENDGGIVVTGGATVYLVVTGYSGVGELSGGMYTDEGEYALEITAGVNTTPTIVNATYGVFGDRLEFRLTADDTDGNLDRMVVGILNEAEALLTFPYDADGNGAADPARLFNDFAAPEEGVTTLLNTVPIYRGFVTDALAAAGAAKAVFYAIDVYGSFAMTIVPLTEFTERGVGEACATEEEPTVECLSFTACDPKSSTCVLDPAIEAACAAATPIEVAVPVTTATTATVTGTLPMTGDGVLMSTCRAVNVPETLYTVTVPANTDLLATTDVAASGTSDTVLYVRATCSDYRTQPDDLDTTELVEGCNDDVDYEGDNFRSTVELRDLVPGTYTVAVEPYSRPTTAIAYGLKVSLRPVLGEGAECDTAGVLSRCATGICASAGGGAPATCPVVTP